ncbi:MAG: response regulator transcription factor [Steroidobacteraceae bacterium]
MITPLNERPATVYVVDDDEAVRDSLEFLLKSVGLPISRHVSAQVFLAAYSGQPGCLVLDMCMPGMSGLELQQHLKARGVNIPVLFITGHGDIPMAVEAMRQGAYDFLTKPFHDQDLIDRVRLALENDARSRRRLSKTDCIPRRLDSLTAREREVLRLVSTGKLNKVIAADLGVSRRTIEVHRAHLMEKLGVRSLAQLVRIVMDVEPRHEQGVRAAKEETSSLAGFAPSA